MTGGCINIDTSRRTRHNECFYWKRDENNRDLSEYTYLKAYDGIFYAKEENSKMKQKNVIGNAFMFNESNVTISTSDSINIESGDIVKYQKKIWRVVSVQERDIHRQSEFLDDEDKITYIQLKR